MQPNRSSPFGNVLRQFREAVALSQEELAERAGLSVRGVSDLERGLRATPRLETVRMLAEGLGLTDEARRQLLEARNPTQQSASFPRHGLPALPEPVTSFIGRDEEIKEIQRMIRRDHIRLVTLLGPGGVGKTRIAIQVAHRLADSFRGGALFVDLSSVSSPERVLPTIAGQLGVAEQPGRDVKEALLVALEGRPLLPVLDNLEQVVEAATDIAWLHASFPELVVIATSRVRLRIAAEHVLPIEPLTVPAADDVNALQQVDAVSLFLDRAHAADPVFVLNDENAPVIAEVIRKLQGMPLAIELAAARIRMLPVADLLKRLETQLSVLGGGARDAPVRQRTMRDTISWSYDLLTPTEQGVFRTLAIFPDGCTLETAVAVLGVDSRFSEEETLDAIESLVDSSMLRRRIGPDGDVRFRMLQTVREFGLEQLAGAGDEAAVRRTAHFAWAVPLVQGAEFIISTSGVARWLGRIRTEHQNLRTHATWLLQRDHAEEALDTSIALAVCNGIRGNFDDSRQELEAILAHTNLHAATVSRMRGLIVLGNICIHQGDAIRSSDVLGEGVQLARELHQQRHIALALIHMGIAMFMMGRIDEAEAFFSEGLDASRSVDDRYGVAAGYRLLAGVAELRGQLQQSHRLFQQSLEISLAEGHTWNVALAKLNLGFNLVLMGDVDQAERLILDTMTLFDEMDSPRELPLVYYTLADISRLRHDLAGAWKLLEEALEIARNLGSMRSMAPVLVRLGRIALLNGTPDEAESLTFDAIDWLERCGDVAEAINCLELAADIAFVRGDVMRAAWCIGAVDGVSNALRMKPLVVEARDREQRVDAVRPLLSEHDWQVHYNRAVTMSEREILAEVKTWQARP